MELEDGADRRAAEDPERPDKDDRSPVEQEDLERGLRFGHFMMSVTQAESRETKVGLKSLSPVLPSMNFSPENTATCLWISGGTSDWSQ